MNTTTLVLENVTSAGDVVDDVMSRTWLRVLFIALYCVIFLVGVSGNGLVVYVIVGNKSMQTPTNIFINNLALSDIMMCLLAVPFTPVSGLSHGWVLGEALCHVVPMSLGVSVYVSTLTSTAIAVDRYFAIVHPFRARMTARMCLLVILAVWVTSVTISLPLAVYQQLSWDDLQGVYVCQEHWPIYSARQFFTVTSLVLQYLVPCSIITVCYSLVSAALRRRSRAKKGLTANGGVVPGRGPNHREQLEIRRNRRTNNMLIAMVTIFVCCWLPLNVINFTAEYYEEMVEWNYYLLIFFVGHVTAMSSTIYNPFLYAWMNDTFRKEFKRVLPCLFGCGRCAGKRSRRGDTASLVGIIPLTQDNARPTAPPVPRPEPEVS